jgi:hypothetical protein
MHCEIFDASVLKVYLLLFAEFGGKGECLITAVSSK